MAYAPPVPAWPGGRILVNASCPIILRSPAAAQTTREVWQELTAPRHRTTLAPNPWLFRNAEKARLSMTGKKEVWLWSGRIATPWSTAFTRSEEHTSELES